LSRMDTVIMRDLMSKRQMSISRQYSVVMSLKLLLGFARDVLRIRPGIDPSEIPLPKRPRPHVETLTNQEVERTLDAISTNTFAGLRLRTLIEVLISTGMRISETLSIDRKPFEQGARELDILGKGGKRRTVFFSERALTWIRTFLGRRADEHPALFITTGAPPRRLSRYDISKYFIDLRHKTGIDKRLSPHVFRHTFCTNLLRNGLDIAFIKQLAGHERIDTTERYYLGVDLPAIREKLAAHFNDGFIRGSA
jgi:integrase/recombinase XerD